MKNGAAVFCGAVVPPGGRRGGGLLLRAGGYAPDRRGRGPLGGAGRNVMPSQRTSPAAMYSGNENAEQGATALFPADLLADSTVTPPSLAYCAERAHS